MELTVNIQAEQSDQGQFTLHGEGQGGGDHVGAVAGDQQVHVVHIKQFGKDAWHQRRIGLVVIGQQPDGATQQAALGVSFLHPDLHGQQCGLAVRRQRTGLAQIQPDGERFGRIGRARGKHGNRQQTAGEAGEPGHVRFPWVFYFPEQ